MVDNVSVTAGSGTVIAADDISSIFYQRVKLSQGADGVAVDVSEAAPLSTKEHRATTGTCSSASLSLTSFTVLASNTARDGATVFNESANLVYLALASASSVTAYTVQLPSGAYYEVPALYSGIVTGIALVAAGSCRVTELT